jgi:Ca-activated chloride channel homolog
VTIFLKEISMRRRPISITAFLLAISCASLIALALLPNAKVARAQATGSTQGGLQAIDSRGNSVGPCPLKRTTVKAEVSGFLSRVRVTQEFENPFKEKIEAVYTFPLPQAAAVDDMTMHVGDRTVRGRILRREEAQAVYEAAKNNGQVASLLDQERPNIFTQSVLYSIGGQHHAWRARDGRDNLR